jgi:nucleoside-diphosphate-sugar epimerase
VSEQNGVDHWSNRESRNEDSADLAAKGYDLRLLCLNPTSCRDVVSADLTKYDEVWARIFSGVDTVIHLAGEPRPTANWDTILPLNITLLLNVLEAMRQYGGSKMIYASSNWVVAGYRFSTGK